VGRLLLGSAVSWFLGGKFHSSRTARRLKTKFQKEQKQVRAFTKARKEMRSRDRQLCCTDSRLTAEHFSSLVSCFFLTHSTTSTALLSAIALHTVLQRRVQTDGTESGIDRADRAAAGDAAAD
jgi:hypothetical protein